MNPETRRLPDLALLRAGTILFLLGLLTGFGVPFYANPRMGLTSHLEGVLNGMFLLVLGLLVERLRLSARALAWLRAIAIYGTCVNWAVTLLAAIWGAGLAMPIAGGGRQGTPAQELLIVVGLATLSLAMLGTTGFVLFGLRRARKPNPWLGRAGARDETEPRTT